VPRQAKARQRPRQDTPEIITLLLPLSLSFFPSPYSHYKHLLMQTKAKECEKVEEKKKKREN
jgi:hypothetical protein